MSQVLDPQGCARLPERPVVAVTGWSVGATEWRGGGAARGREVSVRRPVPKEDGLDGTVPATQAAHSGLSFILNSFYMPAEHVQHEWKSFNQEIPSGGEEGERERSSRESNEEADEGKTQSFKNLRGLLNFPSRSSLPKRGTQSEMERGERSSKTSLRQAPP